MVKISLYSVILEVLSILFGIVLIIIGSVMYSPIDDGAFFYIILVGGIILAMIGLGLFINDMIRLQKSKQFEKEEHVNLELAEE